MLKQAASQVATLPQTMLGLDRAAATFTMYMLFIVIATMFYLFALGVRLNLPKNFFPNIAAQWPPRTNGLPNSLLFFEPIAKFDESKWMNYWNTTPAADVEKDMARNFGIEAFLLAKMAQGKYRCIRWGGRFFRMAIAFLIPLGCGLFSTHPRAMHWATTIGLLAWVGVLILEEAMFPAEGSRELGWARQIGMVAFVLIVMYVVGLRPC
jgi:hypothetical protein